MFTQAKYKDYGGKTTTGLKYFIVIMDTRSRSSTVLMLPWLSQAHISAFLGLAKVLSHRNFCTHVCAATVSLGFLLDNLTEKDSISIKLVELQLPVSPELPPHFHTTTNGLPPHLPPALKEAVDMGKPNFHKILQTLKPDLVLYDFLLPWVPAVASLENVPAVLFLCTGAASASYTIHSRSNPTSEYPFPAIYLPDHQLSELNRTVDATADGSADSERLLDSIERSAYMVLIKTCRDIEGRYIDHLSVLCHKRVIPVGALVQAPAAEDEPTRIIEWLNKKDGGSTLFASFGSESFLSKEETEQIALGIELSEVNFIWAVEQALPEGFIQRVGERAMVMEGWAPQARILSHPSVGGFMSNCRWSSVMESIKFGVPIIAVVAMQFDQPLNARLVEEIGVGEEVVRNSQGILEKDEVERVVRKVLQRNNGEDNKFTKNARNFSMKMREKEQVEVDDALEEMVKLCKKVDRQDSVDMLTQYKCT